MTNDAAVEGVAGRSDRIDQATLDLVVRENGSALLAYARALAGHAEDAEDALQEALSRVLGKRAPHPANLRAYMYKAVHNAVLNSFRARWRRWRREQSGLPEVVAVFQEPAERREEIDMLNAAIGSLPTEQREVVIMKIWGGLSFADIAEGLAIPRDTAASRYRYALEALRKRMRKSSDE